MNSILIWINKKSVLRGINKKSVLRGINNIEKKYTCNIYNQHNTIIPCVRFVDIDGIVHYHCLNFIFNNFC
jgi:hypothetical protein